MLCSQCSKMADSGGVTRTRCSAVFVSDTWLQSSKGVVCIEVLQDSAWWCCYKMRAVECYAVTSLQCTRVTRWGQSSVASWWFPHSYYWTICLTMCGHSAATSFNWISYDFPLSSPPLPGHRYLNRISYGLTSITFQGSLAIPVLQIMIAECSYVISRSMRSIGER